MVSSHAFVGEVPSNSSVVLMSNGIIEVRCNNISPYGSEIRIKNFMDLKNILSIGLSDYLEFLKKEKVDFDKVRIFLTLMNADKPKLHFPQSIENEYKYSEVFNSSNRSLPSYEVDYPFKNNENLDQVFEDLCKAFGVTMNRIKSYLDEIKN